MKMGEHHLFSDLESATKKKGVHENKERKHRILVGIFTVCVIILIAAILFCGAGEQAGSAAVAAVPSDDDGTGNGTCCGCIDAQLFQVIFASISGNISEFVKMIRSGNYCSATKGCEPYEVSVNARLDTSSDEAFSSNADHSKQAITPKWDREAVCGALLVEGKNVQFFSCDKDEHGNATNPLRLSHINADARIALCLLNDNYREWVTIKDVGKVNLENGAHLFGGRERFLQYRITPRWDLNVARELNESGTVKFFCCQCDVEGTVEKKVELLPDDNESFLSGLSYQSGCQVVYIWYQFGGAEKTKAAVDITTGVEIHARFGASNFLALSYEIPPELCVSPTGEGESKEPVFAKSFAMGSTYEERVNTARQSAVGLHAPRERDGVNLGAEVVGPTVAPRPPPTMTFSVGDPRQGEVSEEGEVNLRAKVVSSTGAPFPIGSPHPNPTLDEPILPDCSESSGGAAKENSQEVPGKGHKAFPLHSQIPTGPSLVDVGVQPSSCVQRPAGDLPGGAAAEIDGDFRSSSVDESNFGDGFFCSRVSIDTLRKALRERKTVQFYGRRVFDPDVAQGKRVFDPEEEGFSIEMLGEDENARLCESLVSPYAKTEVDLGKGWSVHLASMILTYNCGGVSECYNLSYEITPKWEPEALRGALADRKNVQFFSCLTDGEGNATDSVTLHPEANAQIARVLRRKQQGEVDIRRVGLVNLENGALCFGDEPRFLQYRITPKWDPNTARELRESGTVKFFCCHCDAEGNVIKKVELVPGDNEPFLSRLSEPPSRCQLVDIWYQEFDGAKKTRAKVNITTGVQFGVLFGDSNFLSLVYEIEDGIYKSSDPGATLAGSKTLATSVRRGRRANC